MAASTQIDAAKKAIRRSLPEPDRRNGMVSFMLRKICTSDLCPKPPPMAVGSSRNLLQLLLRCCETFYRIQKT
jgi:hypothetical protein